MSDRAVELELLYIDDLIAEMLDLLIGLGHKCDYDGLNAIASDTGRYCFVPTTHKVTLGEIVDKLNVFKNQSQTLVMPEIPNGQSFRQAAPLLNPPRRIW